MELGKRKVLGDGIEGRPRKQSRSNEELVDMETTKSERKAKASSSTRISGSTRSDGQKTFAIFKDSSASSDDSDQEKTKTAEEEAYELMVQEPVPDSYWKQLAEQRREALEDTLRENEQLHDEVAELKADNERLKIMADQAEYLATVVQELMGDEEDNEKTQEDTRQNGETSQQTDKSEVVQLTDIDEKTAQSISEEIKTRDNESTGSDMSDDSDL
ncbi:uncharacterized protein [Amphiura filiformis]|uniref:uncharacterized protein n=1 Tax=Amphiura filiformis TaxID=82378 RepID=UPI003B216802